MAKVKEAISKKPKRTIQSGTESLHEMIEKKAYEIFKKRGGQHGRDLDDWLEAERIIKNTKKD